MPAFFGCRCEVGSDVTFGQSDAHQANLRRGIFRCELSRFLVVSFGKDEIVRLVSLVAGRELDVDRLGGDASETRP